MRVRMRLARAPPNLLHLGARLIHREPIRQTAKHPDPWTGTRFTRGRIEGQRNPVLMPDRETEIGGHYTNDRVHALAHTNRLTEHIRRSVEAAAPFILPNHNDRRRAWLLILRQKRAAHDRLDTRQPESRARDRG